MVGKTCVCVRACTSLSGSERGRMLDWGGLGWVAYLEKLALFPEREIRCEQLYRGKNVCGGGLVACRRGQGLAGSRCHVHLNDEGGHMGIETTVTKDQKSYFNSKAFTHQ